MRDMKAANIVALMLCGLSIGWLVGWSESEVVGAVIAALLTATIAVLPVTEAIRAAKGIDAPPDSGTSMVPIALLTIGIAIGASAGLYGRLHEILGKVPPSQTADADDTRHGGGLNAAFQSGLACGNVLSALSSPETMRANMLGSSDSVLQSLAASQVDSLALVNAVQAHCR